jgi:type VI secretion system protein ImpH
MEAPPVGMEALARELKEEAASFGFFQAVRVLELLRPGRAPVGGFADPADEVVRFAVPPALHFPPGEIASLDMEGTGPARMSVYAFGLTGPQGVLPLAYTQMVADRVRERDTAPRDFLDLFHHRMLSLLYRAWRKVRFTVEYGGPHDRLTRQILDLLGLGLPAGREALGLDPETLVFYAGLLAPPTRSPVALEQMLGDYFDAPVEVESFAGGWYRLQGSDLTRVGEDLPSTVLGGGAVVGDEVWDPTARIRIRIGPVARAQYSAFLPGGTAHETLRRLVRFFGHDRLDAEVKLVLRREDVRGLRLGGEGQPPLSWGTWLATQPMERDPDDTVMTL